MKRLVCVMFTFLLSIIIISDACRTSEASPILKSIKKNYLVDKNAQSVKNKVLRNKDYILVYYAANWCPHCRKFTPKLVEFYNKNKKSGNFEVVFVSSDASRKKMEKHMKNMSMPWPAIRYERIEMTGIKKYAGKGIPCLVLFNQKGEIISHSHDGKKYLGPHKVLKDLRELIQP